MVEVISGYEGEDTDKFIEVVKEIWEKQGSRARGAESRYQIVLGTKTKTGALVPTVSTGKGTETVIIWNLSSENMQKIEKEAGGVKIPISSRPYLWFDKVPSLLPDQET